MDELVKLVSQKVGIPEDQAKAAVETVLGFLKQKLPEPYGSRLEDIVAGKGMGDDLLKGLGGLFGGKK